MLNANYAFSVHFYHDSRHVGEFSSWLFQLASFSVRAAVSAARGYTFRVQWHIMDSGYFMVDLRGVRMNRYWISGVNKKTGK